MAAHTKDGVTINRERINQTWSFIISGLVRNTFFNALVDRDLIALWIRTKDESLRILGGGCQGSGMGFSVTGSTSWLVSPEGSSVRCGSIPSSSSPGSCASLCPPSIANLFSRWEQTRLAATTIVDVGGDASAKVSVAAPKNRRTPPGANNVRCKGGIKAVTIPRNMATSPGDWTVLATSFANTLRQGGSLSDQPLSPLLLLLLFSSLLSAASLPLLLLASSSLASRVSTCCFCEARLFAACMRLLYPKLQNNKFHAKK
mmetsp:Transcript_2235/g.5231  ORF Transcript_2235/g.5231 Transcript_2235/m.5231 type:complete len:259 (+) Transcript_2235:835-1611(+)